MKIAQFAPALLILTILNLDSVHGYDTCVNVLGDSGSIQEYREIQYRKSYSNCWEFSVAEDEAVNLKIKKFNIRFQSDSPTYTTNNPWFRTSISEQSNSRSSIRIQTRDSNERALYIYPDSQISDQWILMRKDFNLSLEVSYNNNYYCSKVVDLEFEYKKIDGLKIIEGIQEVKENLTSWLINELQIPLKWKTDIHRAVIALHLSEGVNFSKVDYVNELLIKQLDLKTSVALLRNSSDPVTVNNLGIFVNALLTTCHNPRQFFGYNLVELLKEEVERSLPNSPAAYLALCNANEDLSDAASNKLVDILSSTAEYPFLEDIQALSIMALSCIRRRNDVFANATNDIYVNATEALLKEQLEDGSFGNIYSTAVITQALLSNEYLNRTDGRILTAVKYLVNHLKSPSNIDFLSAYYSLPLFNEKTLLDIGHTDCSTYPKRDRDGATDIENKLGKKIMVQYSLFVGEKKDIVYTIALRVPEDTTAFEIMQLAAEVDPKYAFEHKMRSKKIYVYRIAGITNDPEEGHFWLMYYKQKNSTDMEHIVKSPDQVRLNNEGELILWFRTVHL